ncbi:28S ribosomal protein S27, mitochondrial-like [Diprion similis]|uniref:28S ribosomal protein S27, mitochondrial-like n=1 Tax=Diprion similis TaxID=362088 RepID=UPI001EF8860F|nr:28S ribosomal protein S27, mitochondrial-like [Diprion similis]
MWKTVRICERLAVHLKNVSNCKRTFLSDAYRCDEAWKKRLANPLLEKVDLEKLYVLISQKYSKASKANAVDIDIFANAIRGDGEEIDELIDLLSKLRRTSETSQMLDSTQYAVVRSFMKANRIDGLLTVLHDRLNYGVFPDHCALNILIDSLVKSKDYTSAARAAVLLMLQEDFENEISNALVVYACHMYLKNPGDSWKEPEPVIDKSKEVVKVRVRFLRNPYFDDHFDLQKPAHLVGKTLAMYGKHMGDSIGRTYQLIGLTLYGKYDAATSLVKEWTQTDTKQVLYRDGLELVKSELAKIAESEITDQIKALNEELKMLAAADLVNESLEAAMEKRVKDTVSQFEEKDIASQLEAFSEWEKTRQSVIDQQLAELDKQQRLENIAKIKEDLQQRERVLTFFENEEQIDLIIESRENEVEEKLTEEKPQNVEEENYIPPEVDSRARQTR